MSYLGRVTNKASDIRRFDVTSSTSATHTLTWTAPNEQSLIVTINGVKQQNNYTVSGTTLTLDTALVATDALEVIGINDIGTTITPAQGSVNTDQLATDAVTSAKILDGTIVNADVNASAAIAQSKLSLDIVNANINASAAIDLSKLATNPSITQASSWDMTTDFASDLDPININWVIFPSTYGYGPIGSAMTQSSGLFTFPVTGIWHIFFTADFKLDSAENRYVNSSINTTIDNSSYSRATQQRGSMYGDASLFTYETSKTDFIFDVTDTTLCKCSFGVNVEDNATVTEGGGTGGNPHRTYVTFIRLGDT